MAKPVLVVFDEEDASRQELTASWSHATARTIRSRRSPRRTWRWPG